MISRRFLTSEVVFNALAEVEYLIAIDGFRKIFRNIVLSWNPRTGHFGGPTDFFQAASQPTVGGRAKRQFFRDRVQRSPLT